MIEKLEYKAFDNIGIEYPSIETITDKINELINAVNELSGKEVRCDCLICNP